MIKSQGMKKKLLFWLGLFFVAFITILVWYRLLGEAFMAEGPMYLDRTYAIKNFVHPLWYLFKRHDFQALLFFNVFGNIVRDNMKFYFGFLLITITFIHISIFATVKEATKSVIAGVISASLVTINFVGNFQMLALGTYQYFIQRVPNFFLAFLSLLFLIKFFSTKKFKYYLISFIFYALAMTLAKYTFLFLPVILFYAFLSSVFENSRDYRNWLRGFLYILPFGIWNLLFLINPTLAPSNISFGQFLFSVRSKLILDVLGRMTLMTIPPFVITFLSNASKGAHSYSNVVSNLSYLVGAVYLVITGIMVVKYKKLRIFILSIFLSIPASTVMVLYLRYSIIYENISSRYLYSVAIFVSIFWGLFFYLITKKSKLLKVIVPIFLVCLFVYQRSIILKYFDKYQPNWDEVLSTISFVKSNYKSFPDNSLIVLSHGLSVYHASMFERFYGERNVEYLPETTSDADIKILLTEKAFHNQRVLKFVYNSGQIILQEKQIK